MQKHVILFVLCLALAAPAAADPPQFTGLVTAVAGGDAITVLTASDKRQVSIRLYGIACPVSGQAFGARARQTVSDAVFGKRVTVRPVETERSGSAAALVVAPDGAILNEVLVRDGLAWIHPESCKRRDICDAARTAETRARVAGRGLWADRAPVPPWEWRKAK